MRSAKRNKAQGRLDRMVARVMEMFGKVTGRRSAKVKGKAVRSRGAGRRQTGRAKRAVR